MRCPFCSSENDKVINSRPHKDNREIRRRRECCNCGERFTTFERVEQLILRIVKRDGSREDFSRQKLLMGLKNACRKRDIETTVIDSLIDEIYEAGLKTGKLEISSELIGEMAMQRLNEIDQVAYIRFASVYRKFKSVKEFKDAVDMLDTKK